MPQHRDIDGLASAAWFKFRSAQNQERTRVDAETVFIPHNPSENTLETLHESIEVFENLIDKIDLHLQNLEEELKDVSLQLAHAQDSYLKSRYNPVDHRELVSRERNMEDLRHKVFRLLREKYNSAFDIELLMMGKHWASDVQRYRNAGGAPDIAEGVMAYNYL